MSERLNERIEETLQWKSSQLGSVRDSLHEAEQDYTLTAEDLETIRQLYSSYHGTEEEKIGRLYHLYQTLSAVCSRVRHGKPDH